MTTKLSIVVEGRSDAALLKRILPENLPTARYYAAGGRTSVATVARNILAHEGTPVLVVADADTLDAKKGNNERMTMQMALRGVSSSVPFDVFFFVPELEVMIFETPELVAYFSAGTANELALAVQGHSRPRQALQQLLKSTPREQWFHSLSDAEIELIRRGEQAQKFLGAVKALSDRAS
ncbi:MAG: hypothetical protein NVS9B11_12610 [Candidatus Dormibacteraceae bacterium]